VIKDELRQLLDESIAASFRNEHLAHQLSMVVEDGCRRWLVKMIVVLASHLPAAMSCGVLGPKRR